HIVIFSYYFVLYQFLLRKLVPQPPDSEHDAHEDAEIAEQRIDEVHKVDEADQAQYIADDECNYHSDCVLAAVRHPEPAEEWIQHADCGIVDDQQHDDRQHEMQYGMDLIRKHQCRQVRRIRLVELGHESGIHHHHQYEQDDAAVHAAAARDFVR